MTESTNPDAELAKRVCSGDGRAETELFTKFHRGVMQIIIRVTGRLELAEELSQEAIILTLRRLRSGPLDDPSKLPAFIAQTARNLAIAERRKEARRRTDSGGDALNEYVDLAADEETGPHASDAAAAVRAVLGDLRSDRDREILLRHYLRDEDKEIICRDLRITEATFHVILFRARKRFLALLKKRGIRQTDLFSFALL